MTSFSRQLTLRVAQHLPISLILIAFVAVASVYNVVNPLFEAPDEIWHYLFAQRLRETWQLPVQTPNRAASELTAQQEAAQPPLYYALGAALTFWVPGTPAVQWLRPNEHASIGAPLSEDNKNRFVHSSAEDFPYRGDFLAAHLLRALSTFFGAGTVLLTYLIARELWPARKEFAVAAAGINAFVPQFVYMSAAVNNDVPMAFFSSATLYQALRVARRSTVSHRQALLLGGLSGLAMLTKPPGLATIALIVGAYVPAFLSGRRIAAARACTLAVFTGVALVSWWFVRNLQLYGELMPLKAFLGRSSLRDQIPGLMEVARDLNGLKMSFWGLFGWFSITVDPRLYSAYDLLSLVALVGLAVAFFRKRELRLSRPALALALLWLAAIFALLLQYRMVVQAFQGRLLFPAISPIAALIALGAVRLLPRFARLAVPSLIAIMAIAAIWLAFGVVAPSYAKVLAVESLPMDESTRATDARFGASVELVGYRTSGLTHNPGDRVLVTLYWKALQPIAEDYSVFVQLLDPRRNVVAQKDSFPNGGRNATSLWPVGKVFADEYRLTLPPTLAAPTVLDLQAGLYLKKTMQRLRWRSATDQEGDALVLRQLRVVPRSPNYATEFAAAVAFADRARLAGYSLGGRQFVAGEELRGVLLFVAQGRLERDYTVFVHMVGPIGVVAQSDEQPMDGLFPTSAWLPGDIVPHPFTINIPGSLVPGSYALVAGLYDLTTGARLPAEQQDHAELGLVQVAAGR